MKSLLLRILAGIIVLGAVLWFAFHQINVTETIRALKLFSWVALAEVVALALLISLFKSIRFFLLVKGANLNIGFWETLRIFIAGQAATPLPGGEAVRGMLLKKETDGSHTQIAGPIISQVFLEMGAAILILGVGGFFYPPLVSIAVLATLVFVVVSTLMLHPSALTYLIGPLIRWPRMNAAADAVIKTQTYMRHILVPPKGARDSKMIQIGMVALAADIVGGLLIFTIAHYLAIPLSFFPSLILYAASVSIQGIASIIPAGLGVTEGGMIGLLGLFQISVTLGVPLVIIFRLATLALSVILGLMVLIVSFIRSRIVSRANIV